MLRGAEDKEKKREEKKEKKEKEEEKKKKRRKNQKEIRTERWCREDHFFVHSSLSSSSRAAFTPSTAIWKYFLPFSGEAGWGLP